MQEQKLYKVKEAAKIIGISPEIVLKNIRKGFVDSVYNGRYMIDNSAIEKLRDGYKSPDDMEGYMSMATAASTLNVATSTVTEMIRNGCIRFKRNLKKQYCLLAVDVEEIKKRQKQKPVKWLNRSGIV